MDFLIVVVGLLITMPTLVLVTFIKVRSLEKRLVILTKKVAELSSDLFQLEVANSPSKAIDSPITNQVAPCAKSIPPNLINESIPVDNNASEPEMPKDSMYQQNQSSANLGTAHDGSAKSIHQSSTQSVNDLELESLSTSSWLTMFFKRWIVSAKENWLVWVGGVALVIGVAYLIETVGSKYSIPISARVFIAILLSCSVIGGGEWLHKKILAFDGEFLHQKADAYIPAAVYGAGMSGLYGTILFSSVIHSFITPPVALSMMALLAAVSLALTKKLGPLMAVLGLFGGYTAPIWIGGSDPSFILLSCYITSITIAGLWVQQLTRIPWLTFGIIGLHSLWLAAIVNALPQEDSLLWYLLFIPFTTYLLVFVPQMGWRLQFQCQYRTRAPFFYATIPAIILGLITLFLVKGSTDVGLMSLSYYSFPLLLLFIPCCRNIRAPRTLSWLNIVAVVFMMVLTDSFLKTHLDARSEVLLISACIVLLVFFRTTGQYWQGDKSVISYWQVILLAPSIMIGALLYIDYVLPEYRLVTTLFVVFGMILLLCLASKLTKLSANLSGITHALLLTISIVYSDGGELTLLIAFQMLIMAMQYKRGWLAPNLLVLKVLGALLVLRQSILSFWPDLLALPLPKWTWVLSTILPTLMVFSWIRHTLMRSEQTLVEWFDAAMLHLAVILVFAQTNYLLLGHFNFLGQLEFENIAIFACQGLVLAGVYQFKAYRSQSLNLFYRGYSVILMVTVMVCMVILNTRFQPLQTTNVLGSDWPIFNWLSIGWLIPGLLVLVIVRMQLFHEYTRWLLGAASVIVGLWCVYSIRQFWQQGAMTHDMPTSMAELFSYSVALILVGVATSYYGLQHERRQIQTVGFAMLGFAVFKVFLWDAAELEGLWRAISFIGLGGCLVTLGWLFQRLSVKSLDEL